MPVAADEDMRNLDAPPVEGCPSLITDVEQPSNIASTANAARADHYQAQPITDGTFTDDGDGDEMSEPRRESSSESLEAFVAETERECDVLAQDVLRGGGGGGDGEGMVATSFDNSLSPAHEEDGSSLCSLRAELAQATPEKAGIVLIEEDSDDDDSSSIGGGSTCFGGGSSAGAVATPKAGRHDADNNEEQGDGSDQSAGGRGRTPPKRRRSLGSAPGRRTSWLRLPGINSNANVSTRTSTAVAATRTADDDAGPTPLAQPLTALDHVLLDDMAKDDVGVGYESFRSRDNGFDANAGYGTLEDMSVQSRALAAGAEAGAAAAARDDSSIGATSFITATSQFLHPLHNQNGDGEDTTSKEKSASAKWSVSTRKLSGDHKARINSFGSRQPSRRMSDPSKPPGILILGDLTTSIRSLSTLGGGGDDNSIGPSVSTIASSVHSGAVVAKQRSRISLLNEKLDAKLKTKISRRRLLYEDDYYHDEDDIDWQLEEEIFAEEDAMNNEILLEAHGLMAQVNKSVSSLGVDPPFQPTEDIMPNIVHLHASLKFQLIQSKAAGIVAEAKGTKGDRENSLGTGNVSESNKNNGANASSPSKAVPNEEGALPPLDNRQALVDFFMQRMREASLKDVHSMSYPSTSTQKGRSERGSLDYQQFTAFLPNYLWYQPISDDRSSIMRPTSMCSGTGIGSGLKYIDPDMMAIFSLFGSYFAGALSEEEMPASPSRRDQNFCPRRSARWLNTIDEGGDSESENESVQGPDDTLLIQAGGDLDSEKANSMVFSDAQMGVIQSAIEELLSNKMDLAKVSERGGDFSSDKMDSQGSNEARLEHIADDGDSSEFHSADEDADVDQGKDFDGFLVGFPQN